MIEKLKDQQAANDYLANVVSEQAWAATEGDTSRYPYPTEQEMSGIRAAFDHFFETIESRETESGVQLYSRSEGIEKAAAELTERDELFQFPIPNASDMQAIFAELDPAMDVTERKLRVRGKPVTRWLIRTEDAHTVIVTEQGGEIYANLASLEAGRSGGQAIYAGLSHYAHQNNLKFIPDPDGLSEQAVLRRPEFMLSSALKYGTTRHLGVSDELTNPKHQWARQLRWRTGSSRGDYLANLRELMETSYHNVRMLVPEIEGISYNFHARRFENAEGNEFTDRDFDALAERVRDDYAGHREQDSAGRFGPGSDQSTRVRLAAFGDGATPIGRTTLKRAALTHTLVREESGARWRRVLGEITRQQGQGLDPALRQIFYSTAPAQAGVSRSSPEKALAALTPRARRALVDSGLVTITESPSQWPGNHPADAAGAWINGKIYLATDNIAEGAERGLILHEVGVHHGLKDMLGDQYRTLVRQLQRQVERGGRPGAAPAQREAYEAHQRALADDTIQGNQEAIWEETIAYMAEAGADTSLFRQIVAAVRNFLRDLGLVRGFTNADVAHLARGSVARIVEGVQAEQGRAYAPVRYQLGLFDQINAERRKETQNLRRKQRAQLEFKRDGKPYATRDLAQRAARRLSQSEGLDYVPAPYGDQWALIPEHRRAEYLEQFPDGAIPDGTKPADDGGQVRYSLNDQNNREIEQSVAATPAVRRKQEKGQPISRRDVLEPLLRGLNVPVYHGRVKKGESQYLPKRQAIRVRKMNDVEATTFELGYLLRERFKQIPAMWTGGANRNIRKELQALSKTWETSEGFAHFTQLYLMENEAAAEVAPEAYERFNQALDQIEGGQAVRDAVRDIHAWHAQDVLNQARSKIGVTEHLAPLTDHWRDRIRQGVFDDLHGIRMMEEQITGEREVKTGIYENARLIRGAGAIVEGAMHSWGGTPYVKKDGSFGYRGKALETILEPVADQLDDFILYAVGRSANELMQQGRERLFSRAEIKAMRALETPAFKRAFDDYQAWNEGILDFAQELGIIDPDARAKWRRMQYIPFYRLGDQDQPPLPPTKRGEGVEGNWKGIKALTGGTGNLNDILGNMIQNARALIEEAVKNDARRRIADAAESFEGGGQFMVPIDRESAPVRVDRDQIRLHVRRAMAVKDGQTLTPDQEIALEHMEQAIDEMGEFVQMWIHGRAPKGDDVFAVLRDGQPTFYQVGDPFLLRSLMHFNRPVRHPVIRFLSVVRRIGQTTVTLTPEFMIANFARDTLLASILSRHGFKPFMDSVRGMKSRLSKDQNYRDFMANGGGLSSLHADYLAYRKHLERFYGRKGISMRSILDTLGKWLYALERLSESVEMGTRADHYRAAVARGEHPRHAAYLAREIGSDYAMRGDGRVVNFLYDTVMFLKAGQNGLDRIYRGFTRDENRGAIAAKTGMLAMASAMLYLHNRGIPEYDELEDWDKDVHWHILVPDGEGGHHHFRYPKIWQVGGIASIAERNMGALMDHLEGEGADGQKLIRDIIRITRDANFIGVTPHFVDPWLEQYSNRNSFTGAPIESMNMQNLEPWARATPYTNELLTDLGAATMNFPRGLQVNPVRAEALLRGYFNTWASYGLDIAEQVYGTNKPVRRADEMPVVRRFYKQQPARRTRFETQYYDMLREAQQAHRTINEMVDQGRLEDADRLEERRGTLLDVRPDLTQAQRELQSIHRDMREIQRDPVMDRREKRRQLDELQTEKNRLLEELIRDVEEFEAEAGG